VGFPLDIRTELLLSGVWSDISPDVYVRDAKQITRGRRDQGQTADPSRLTLTLNNKSGKYSPRNAMSPLYGQIGRNTQLRVSVPAADKYLNLVGDPNSYVSTPDTAALDITGDIDIRAEIQPNWYGPDNQMIIGKWETVGAQCAWFLKVYQGVLNFQHSVTGSPTNAWSYTRSLQEIPARGAVRVTLDVDNGAGGRTVRWYTAPSIAGPWTQLGPDTVLPGTVALVNTSAPLKIGPTDLTTAKPARKPFIGRGFKFEVRAGINGTVVASPDFTAQSAGASSFTDSAGRVWTMAGGAEIRDREDRFVGEVSSWPAKWTPDESDVYVPVEANGILRRLGQGLKALDSTLRRRIPSGDPIAYWPMEESQYATRAYSPLPGVDSAALSGVEWASADDLPSSLPLPRIKAPGALSAPVPVAASGEWHVEFVYNADGKAPEFDQPHAEVIRFSSPNGTVRNWVLGVHKGSAMWRVWGYNANGDDLVFHTFTPGDVLNGWVRLRFWAKDNGDGTFNFRIGWQDVSGETYGYTQTITGTCGRLNNIAAAWGAGVDGWSIGHLSVLPVAGSTIYDYSDDAFVGDTAWNRILRLGTEENVPVERIHGQDITSALVGPQRPDTLINLLESAAEADGGFILETKDRVGLAFRDRASMYTQAPALTLSYNSPGLAPDLEPIDDDSAVRNDIVVQRDGGSAARAFLADGALSVQAPPLGIGVYDEQVTLSLGNDGQPEPMANWLLHLGTFDGARYPTVTVMLHKPGAEVLIPQILALREGDKIRLTDLPAWLSHEDVDLIVEGYAETLDLYRWEITFNCSPGGPWEVAQVGSAKANTDGTILATAVNATATSLVTQVTAGPQWVTNPAEFPFDVTAGGERMTVTSVTSALADTFTRTATNGWGTADTGQPWVIKSGAAADFDVTANAGRHLMNTRNLYRITALDSVSIRDVETLVKVTCPVVPTGDGLYLYSLARTDSAVANFYFARIFVGTNNVATLSLRKRTPAETVLATASATMPNVAGQAYKIRLRVEGNAIMARAWRTQDAEPGGWQVTATDTDLPAAGGVGVRTFISTTNTNTLPVAVPWDDFQITNAQKFNVTRSANGVVKSHAAGESVALARPAIVSL
jgi:hypothetical protein